MILVSSRIRSCCRSRNLLLIGLLVAGLATNSRAAGGEPDKTFQLPVQKFEPLPGKVVGVLASNSQTLLANEGRKGPANAVTFGTGTGSQRWIYLPDQKKPMIAAMLFPVGPDGKKMQRFNRLNFANAENLKAFGITERFALAEVEVNGGQGSPASQTFVATSIKAVEGTKQYPLKVAEVIDRLQSRFDEWNSGNPYTLETALARQRKELGWLKGKETKRNEEKIFYVSWIPSRKVLQVQMLNRLQEHEPVAALTRPAIAYQGNDGTPPKTKAERTVGAEEGLGFEVSRFGKIERMDPIPLKEFHRAPAQLNNVRAVSSR
jgi:hypothetical protein